MRETCNFMRKGRIIGKTAPHFSTVIIHVVGRKRSPSTAREAFRVEKAS